MTDERERLIKKVERALDGDAELWQQKVLGVLQPYLGQPLTSRMKMTVEHAVLGTLKQMLHDVNLEWHYQPKAEVAVDPNDPSKMVVTFSFSDDFDDEMAARKRINEHLERFEDNPSQQEDHGTGSSPRVSYPTRGRGW
jgi:hypothetical protein